MKDKVALQLLLARLDKRVTNIKKDLATDKTTLASFQRLQRTVLDLDRLVKLTLRKDDSDLIDDNNV